MKVAELAACFGHQNAPNELPLLEPVGPSVVGHGLANLPDARYADFDYFRWTPP